MSLRGLPPVDSTPGGLTYGSKPSAPLPGNSQPQESSGATREEELAFLEFVTCEVCDHPFYSNDDQVQRKFWMTSCGHIICSGGKHENQDTKCTKCGKEGITASCLDASLPPDLHKWFYSSKQHINTARKSYASISEQLKLLHETIEQTNLWPLAFQDKMSIRGFRSLVKETTDLKKEILESKKDKARLQSSLEEVSKRTEDLERRKEELERDNTNLRQQLEGYTQLSTPRMQHQGGFVPASTLPIVPEEGEYHQDDQENQYPNGNGDGGGHDNKRRRLGSVSSDSGNINVGFQPPQPFRPQLHSQHQHRATSSTPVLRTPGSGRMTMPPPSFTVPRRSASTAPPSSFVPPRSLSVSPQTLPRTNLDQYRYKAQEPQTPANQINHYRPEFGGGYHTAPRPGTADPHFRNNHFPFQQSHQVQNQEDRRPPFLQVLEQRSTSHSRSFTPQAHHSGMNEINGNMDMQYQQEDGYGYERNEHQDQDQDQDRNRYQFPHNGFIA